MTYEESATLMTDMTFRGRVKVACLHFADYIMNEAQTVPAHNVRMKWAANAFQVPDSVAQQVQQPTVNDAKVQASGANISDADLQTAVETTINKMF